jgi:LysR family glycine cleavage system transcriptional activator
MTRAAVSQQVLSLEQALGRALFERSANRIELTSAGNDLLPTIQISLGTIESKVASLFAPQRMERLTLEASQLMAMSWLPQVLADFHLANSHIKVELHLDLKPSKTPPDLAIRFGEEPQLVKHPGKLMGLSYVVLCRPEDAMRITSLDDLLAFRLLEMPSRSMGWAGLLSHHYGPMRGKQLNLETVDNTPMSLMMVGQGLGLAVGPMPVCKPMADALGLVTCPLIPATPGPGNYFLEHPSNEPQRSAVIKLEQALQAAAHNAIRPL